MTVVILSTWPNQNVGVTRKGLRKAVLDAKAKESEISAEKAKRKLEKDLENENGGAAVYSANLKKNYILANDEWKEDAMPEILDGQNVYDFIDPDILVRLEELEREESVLQGLGENDDFEMDGNELSPEEKAILKEIRRKKSLLIQQHRMKKSTAGNRPIVPRKFDKEREFTIERMGRQLSSIGFDPTMATNRARSRGRKTERSIAEAGDDRMEVDEARWNKMQRVSLSLSLSFNPRHIPATSREPYNLSSGMPSVLIATDSEKRSIKKAKTADKNRNKNARRGEADRVIPNLKPKHLFSGKRSTGKTQRR